MADARRLAEAERQRRQRRFAAARRRAMVMEQLVRARDPRSARAGGDGAPCRATAFVDPSLRRRGLRRPAAADRVRADDLAAVHGRARDRAGARRRPRDRALEVGAGCGYQAAVLARAVQRGIRDRDHPRAGGARAPHAGRARLHQRRRRLVRRQRRLAGARAVRRHHRLGRRAARAAAAGRPAGRRRPAGDPVGAAEEQELALVRRQGDDYETSYDTRCRYVDLLGRFGVGGSPPDA